MKKLLCLLCILAIAGVPLASCHKAPSAITAEQVVASFSAQAQVTQQESVIGCNVARTPEGLAAVTITAPEQLSGMCFEWSGENSGFSYQGLSCRTEQPFLPKTSFAAIIVNVLQAASVPENLTDQGPRDGMSCFTGQSESGPFTILVNSSNGYIQEILLEELDFRAVFSGQTA